MFKKFLLIAFAISFFLMSTSTANAQIPGWIGSSGNPAEFLVEVSKGNVPGHSVVHKFGHASVATTFAPVCNSLVYQTPTTAITLEVVSSDADDTAAGAGAQAVTIEGLALDGSIVIQTVELNGLTAVAIPTDLWRVYRWYVSRSGVYATTATGSHQGTLTIRVETAGATWSTISVAGYAHGQSEIAWYTVPAGFRAYIFAVQIKVDSIKSVDVLFVHRADANDVTTPFSTMRMINEFVGVSGAGTQTTAAPVGAFPAFTDIGFMGKVLASTGDISIDYEILLIADGY